MSEPCSALEHPAHWWLPPNEEGLVWCPGVVPVEGTSNCGAVDKHGPHLWAGGKWQCPGYDGALPEWEEQR